MLFFGRPPKEDTTKGALEWLIVGLGNPGAKYLETRHNAGWQVLDTMGQVYANFRFDEQRNKAFIARGELEGIKIGLVKPQTYMNLSGEAVAPIARFYKIPTARILVAFDDLDLPLADLRLRPKGGAGGHKGMQSLIQHFGTQDFPRLRLGIGRPPGQMSVEGYVLQAFTPSEREAMAVTYRQAVEAIKTIVTIGLERAMNEFN